MLDVVVGLVFMFLAISLAVSAIVEAVASIVKWRSTTLLKGVKDLLNDPQFTGLARDIYNHALIDPRDGGRAQSEAELRHAPGYIDPNHFADALIDMTRLAEQTPDRIKAAIRASIADAQIRNLLSGVVDRTAGDIERIRRELAGWFDSAMGRVSGAYKRKTQAWSFGLALILVGGLNVSAIDVGRALWLQPMATRTISPKAEETLAQALTDLQSLGSAGIPIGWTKANSQAFCSTRGIWTFLGWLITAFAALFGAAFWFDALQQIVHLRGSGASPAEKRAARA